ncbi:MAG TPA: hypothetical protein VF201_00155 [Nitrolancea sp.]
MKLDWLLYELRRVGLVGLLTPVLIILFFSSFGLLMRTNGVSPDRATRAVVAGLEIGVATAAGLIAATIVTSDSLLELHLSLMTRYRTTFARRLALMLGWTALVGIGTTLVVRLIGHELAPVSLLAQQLVWLAPLACFTGVGALLTLLLRSRTGAAAVLAGIWIIETLLHESFGASSWLHPFFLFATTYSASESFWLGNRLELIALGLLFGALSLIWLKRNPSILLGGEG